MLLYNLQKHSLSITYVDSFEVMSSPDNMQQYVAIEYVGQVQVDEEKGIMREALESIHEVASVEEVFCSELSPESMYSESVIMSHYEKTAIIIFVFYYT